MYAEGYVITFPPPHANAITSDQVTQSISTLFITQVRLLSQSKQSMTSPTKCKARDARTMPYRDHPAPHPIGLIPLHAPSQYSIRNSSTLASSQPPPTSHNCTSKETRFPFPVSRSNRAHSTPNCHYLYCQVQCQAELAPAYAGLRSMKPRSCCFEARRGARAGE